MRSFLFQHTVCTKGEANLRHSCRVVHDILQLTGKAADQHSFTSTRGRCHQSPLTSLSIEMAWNELLIVARFQTLANWARMHIYKIYITYIKCPWFFPLTNPVAKMFSNHGIPFIPSITTWVSHSSLSIRCFNSHVLHKVISGHPFGAATRIGHGDEEGRQQNAWQVSENNEQTWFSKSGHKKKQIGSDVIDVCWDCWDCWDCCDVLSFFFFWGGGAGFVGIWCCLMFCCLFRDFWFVLLSGGADSQRGKHL